MSSLSRYGLCAVVIVAASTVGIHALAQMPSDHHQGTARQGQMMHGEAHGDMQRQGTHGGRAGQAAPMTGQPTLPGQDAFGTIEEIVRILEADPTTDWSKVNITILREHLIDMNELTLRATADPRALDNGVEIAVTGEGRTLVAIMRMVPAHVAELVKLGWNAKSEDLPNGVKLVVTSSDPEQATKLRALGFMGIMVQGGHHQHHHLMMAKGEMHAH
jgi:hypothetical protein